MSIGRVALACAQVACLLAGYVPEVHAELTDSIAKFKHTLAASFAETSYYPPSPPQVATPVAAQAQAAVAAPILQIDAIRQYLDQFRIAVRAMAGQSPRVSVNGVFGQSASGSAPASDASMGNAQKGGGASADSPDPFERWGAFLIGDFDVARQSTVDTQPGFKTRTNHITIGGDYRFPGNSVLGAAVAFMKSDADFEGGAGTQDARGYGFTFFGSYVPVPDAYVDAIVNIGHNNYDGQRNSSDASFSSDTSGNQWGFAVSAGYAFNSDALTLTPYGRVEYVDAKVNGYTESGVPAGVATISEQRIKATTLSLGAQASYAIGTSWGVFVPNGRVEYQHLANSSRGNPTAQFGTLPPAPIPLLGEDKNYGTFAVGASGVFAGGVTAFFNYQQLFGKSDVRDQRYTVGLRMEF